MFRHSELEALRRERDKKPPESSGTGNSEMESGECVGRESPFASLQEQPPPSTANKKKRKTKNGAGRNKPYEPKPDLRKRTWDVVDTGLDSLEYD